ncbi:DUF1617 family protein [Enterococcus diestrammenae]|uniref:Phage protein n=1 Tax=Enterococcus diestrammenae TaxID=1155073 RepID=A0ABV0F378_9ENTE|nr:DUF1617 family protein [Enterococcus diestrammenae]KAF1296521.1 hypothetical protein BAU18_11985 [Enterococcus diestrammenae]
MKIELKNKELSTAINFLKGMTLQAKDSRCRSKLVKLLTTAFNELSDEEKKLMEEHGLLNEDGELKKENELDNEKIKKFNKEQDTLMDEVVVIEGGMYAKNIDEMPRILESYTGELSGVDAEIYDRLMDEMEKESAE